MPYFHVVTLPSELRDIAYQNSAGLRPADEGGGRAAQIATEQAPRARIGITAVLRGVGAHPSSARAYDRAGGGLSSIARDGSPRAPTSSCMSTCWRVVPGQDAGDAHACAQRRIDLGPSKCCVSLPLHARAISNRRWRRHDTLPRKDQESTATRRGRMRKAARIRRVPQHVRKHRKGLRSPALGSAASQTSSRWRAHIVIEAATASEVATDRAITVMSRDAALRARVELCGVSGQKATSRSGDHRFRRSSGR